MSELSHNEIRHKFMPLYIAGVNQEDMAKQLRITEHRLAGLMFTTNHDEKEKRRLARRSIRENQYYMRQALLQAERANGKFSTLSRAELLAQIKSLLRDAGIFETRSYDSLPSENLFAVRDRLMRNRSDKYQYSSTAR